MFAKNMGQTDRTIRIVAGAILLLLALFALSGGWAWVLGIVGAVLLATAVLGYCPPYQILGINTCNTKNS